MPCERPFSPRPLPRRYAVGSFQQRNSLCQATLSIGLYLLLEVQFQHYFYFPNFPGLFTFPVKRASV
jgi:hypothetical protein